MGARISASVAPPARMVADSGRPVGAVSEPYQQIVGTFAEMVRDVAVLRGIGAGSLNAGRTMPQGVNRAAGRLEAVIHGLLIKRLPACELLSSLTYCASLRSSSAFLPLSLLPSFASGGLV